MVNGNTKKLLAIIIFGIFFGLVEAAVVVYLRGIIGFKDTYPIMPSTTLLNLGFISFVITKSPILNSFQAIETVREAATIIMLASVAYLAGEKSRSRLAAFAIAFSFWDIFYYVFLKVFVGWPKSLFDIDILFIIPVTWIGPIITPMVIFTIVGILGIKAYLKQNDSK